MNGERYYLLDELRGLTLISMIAYHAMYDLVELYGVSVAWFWKLPGYVWQQSICWTFILLSGFCWNLGKKPLKRGLTVFAGGLVITIITSLFLPSQRIIFGILTFTGTAMMVMIPLSRMLSRIPASWGLFFSALLFFFTRNINIGYWGFESLRLGMVPNLFYQGWTMTFLGFPQKGFYSGDYFSFFPWIFLFLFGYYLFHATMRNENVKKFLRCRFGMAKWIGKHSLPIYMIHQPILMIIFLIVFEQ